MLVAGHTSLSSALFEDGIAWLQQHYGEEIR